MNRRELLVAAGAGAAGVPARRSPPPVSRQAFARRMSTVGVAEWDLEPGPNGESLERITSHGWSPAQVREWLGAPDEVRLEEFGPGREPCWCYGVDEPGSLPTLGKVQFLKGEAAWVYGSRGPVIPAGSFPEAELRPLLRLLDTLPGADWFVPMGELWDPAVMIRIVNRLQSLGKTRAIATLNEFCRVISAPRTPEERFYKVWVETSRPILGGLVSLLFEAPPEPDDFPGSGAFSIELRGDIPFMLSQGGGLGGYAGFASPHLEHRRTMGRLRPRPLVPASQPWRLLRAFPRAEEGPYPAARALAMNQVLRLLAKIYPLRADRVGNLIPSGRGFEERWAEITRDLERLSVHWDERRNGYVAS